MLKQYLNDKEGAAAIVFALTIPLVIGGITLAVELGHWNQNKSKLQDLADVSAKAAAYEIMVLKEHADYEMAGKGHAFENGFNFTKGNMTVVSPPVTGKYAGKKGVEVILQQEQPMYFAKYLGSKTFNLETRATALMMSGVPACVLSLSETASPAFSVSGSATINVSGCSVHTNSSDAQSVEVGDKDNFTADCLTSVGGIDAGPGTNLTDCSAVEPYNNPIPDPYSDVSVPDLSALPCAKPVKINRWDLEIEASPHHKYCANVRASGAIMIKGSGPVYFDGADLDIKSQYAYLYGRGVTVVFTNGGVFTSGNGGMLDVTAPTTGPYAGIVIYYDAATTPLGLGVKINGNISSNIEGVIYAPTVDLVYNGGAAGMSDCTQIIANTVELTGNAEFVNRNCEAAGTRQIGGMNGVALVE